MQKRNNPEYVPQWYQSIGMDQRVEKLESDVNSLMTGQLQILEKINELFGKLNSKNSLPEANMEREEGEPSNSPPHD